MTTTPKKKRQRVTKSVAMPKLAPKYKVILLNDSVNSFPHVVLTLIKIFHFSQEDAERITMEAHKSGRAICAILPYEHAELRVQQLHSEKLGAELEKVEI